MKIVVLFCVISVTVVLCSCNNSIRSDQNGNAGTFDNYESKAKVIETFLAVDYESAYEIADQARDYQVFNAEIMSIHSECSTPWMLYLSTADCSLCIVADLDFMQSFFHLSKDFETPAIVLKEGDKEIFDFYREKQLSQMIDAKTIEKLQKFHVFNIHSDDLKNFKDGIYLVYRNRIINYMQWPPMPTARP